MFSRYYPYMEQWHDFIIAPLYFGLLVAIGLLLRKRYTQGRSEVKKYFMPALIIRLLCGILAIAINEIFLYGSDMIGFYNGSLALWHSFWENPIIFFEILLKNPQQYSPDAYNYFVKTRSTYYLAGASIYVVKIGGLLSLITFKSIFGISLILSFASFIGCWRLYDFFCALHPKLYKHFAYGILFVPSMFFWGAAGLCKEPILVYSLGVFVWNSYQFFILKRQKIKSLFFILIGIYGMLIIKPYVPIVVIPTFFFWLLLWYNGKIKNKVVKRFTLPIFLIVISIGGLFLLQQILSVSGKFGFTNFEEFAQVAKGIQTYSVYRTKMAGGAGYTFGNYEPTITGLLSVFPQSINVTLFRPYLWEATKPLIIPSMIESLMTLLVTLFVLLKVGFFRSIKKIISSPDLIFSMLISLTLASAIGFVTFNFGTLVRYKIPLLPFYFAGLAILYSKRKRKRKYLKN